MKRWLEAAGKDPDTKNREVYTEVVKSLAEAGEASGRDNAELMASVMADQKNAWMAEAMRAAIESGKGALLGVATSAKVMKDDRYGHRERLMMSAGVARGIDTVRKDFSTSTGKVKALLSEKAQRRIDEAKRRRGPTVCTPGNPTGRRQAVVRPG